MPLLPRQHGLRFLACAWVTLAAVGGAPSKGVAGCSGHVAIRSDAEGVLSDLEVLTHDPRRTSSVLPAPRSTPPPGRPGPCPGASCSGLPPVAPPAPTLTVPPRAELWVDLTATPSLARSAGRPLAIPEGRDRPLVQGPLIDRPPRASARLFSS